MKLLLDTNILISLEPARIEEIEARCPVVAQMVRLAQQGGHSLMRHPASDREVRSDRDRSRLAARSILFKKYPPLPAPPAIQLQIEARLGRPAPESHDLVDHLLLAAVAGDAVELLVTDDHGVLRKAESLRLRERVLTPSEAVSVLLALGDRSLPPPPAVRREYCHELSADDPIFDSLRSDYQPEFDDWLRKCKREQRETWVVRSGGGALEALCIFKREASGEHGLHGKVLKLCTFKVSDAFRGRRLGELLLKTSLCHAFENSFDVVYAQVLPRHEDVVSMFETFGFADIRMPTPKGELVLAKNLKFTSREYDHLDPLEFHRRFGPRHVKVVDAFVVPITPYYHDLLFPELAEQPKLFDRPYAFGNGILKAYLSNAATRELLPGSTLLFYKSGGSCSVGAVGVIERVAVSGQADRVAAFVGERTVYSYSEIRSMCGREVLAILFRQASGALFEPISLDELVDNHALRAAPQSIVRVKPRGLPWIRNQIELSP